jgi:very-long-chain enoyl-CoA reductase
MRPRTHNVVSYSLALLVFIAVAAFRSAALGRAALGVELGAGVGATLWCAHFVRRAAESAWLHRYGKPRVGWSDIVVEYLYYGGFAAWNAAALFGASYRSPRFAFIALGGALFVIAELGNAKAHRMLRDLRAPGSLERKLPRGFLFERVSCPHYLFEILAWVGFAIATQTWAAFGFVLLSSGILGAWAHTRHVAYRAEFDGRDGRELYPPRSALLPGIF